MTFQPITPNWLTAGWDQFTADDPELQLAYDWSDYPSDRSGEGNWTDLYLDESDEFPVGRLWINPDTENIGLQALPQGNISYLTKIALELREFRHNGADPLTAYEYIKRDYFAGEEQTGDLADARAQNQED
jgi:hypothetical protein